MPHNVPIKLRQLKELGVLDEDRFFSDIADEAGMSDPDSIRRMYMAMVRVITKRLLSYHGTRLPHLGDMQLPLFKERMGREGTRTVKIPSRRAVKFYPNQLWHKHINAKLGYHKY